MVPETQPGKYGGVGKVAAISAVIFMVSLGLCGISLHVFPDDYVTLLGLASLVGMVGGALGILGAGVSAIMLLFTPDPKDKP